LKSRISIRVRSNYLSASVTTVKNFRKFLEKLLKSKTVFEAWFIGKVDEKELKEAYKFATRIVLYPGQFCNSGA
jgi:hypothetical protein